MKGLVEIKNLERLNSVISNEPFKVYSLTRDGNGNEIEVFESAFDNLEDAKLYKPNHDDWECIVVDVEDDY